MYVDVVPSEQLDADDPNDVICLVAVGYTHRAPNAFEIRQVKTYRGKQRKLRAAEHLSDVLSGDYFVNLRVICGLARITDILSAGTQLLGQVPASAGSVSADGAYFCLQGHRVSSRRAHGLAWYASALAMFSAVLANLARHVGAKEACFLLDPLPGDTPGGSVTSLNLVKAITDNSELRKYWRQFQTRMNGRIGFAYGLVDGGPSDPISEAKKSDLSILADWLAQACHAAANTRLVLASGYSEGERQLLANPFFVLHRKGTLVVVDIGSGIEWAECNREHR